jgi:predicted nucleic acid-binding protein
MILVDTSAWVDFFRGRGPLAAVVDQAIEDDEAAVCGPVMAELRRGLSPTGRDRVLELLENCPLVVDPPYLWREAGDLGYLLGRRGVSIKRFDLLIAAIALAYDLPILTRDSDFQHIRKSGVARLRILE